MTTMKIKRRQAWMREFEATLISIEPHRTGKVCWDTAAHLFRTGIGPKEAAHRFGQTQIDLLNGEAK